MAKIERYILELMDLSQKRTKIDAVMKYEENKSHNIINELVDFVMEEVPLPQVNPDGKNLSKLDHLH